MTFPEKIGHDILEDKSVGTTDRVVGQGIESGVGSGSRTGTRGDNTHYFLLLPEECGGFFYLC